MRLPRPIQLRWLPLPAAAAFRLLPPLLGASALIVACGAVYWWIEPKTPSFGEGVWLAFVTAATVGYGDYVPSTPGARVFSVVVVLLGFAVLSLVTATIAASWVESSEREIEREILRDMHGQIGKLRAELAELREAMERDR
jgi:voltage-gated potassium channel